MANEKISDETVVFMHVRLGVMGLLAERYMGEEDGVYRILRTCPN